MSTTQSEALYRSAAAEGATFIGLLLVVYDALASDLQSAAHAARRNDIAARCNASNHALLLLAHLESWIPSLDDPALGESLTQFYAYLRAQTLAVQASAMPEAFEELARLVSETRAIWHRKEAASHPVAAPAPLSPRTPPPVDFDDTPRLSWSA